MAVIIHRNLFSWEEVERSSDLKRLELVLSHLPDEALVSTLERERGRGRDTYPIRAMWNALIAGVVFQHPSIASLLRELRRNGELRQLCGFNPVLGAEAVPTPSAMSRFLKNVVRHEELIRKMFYDLVERAKELLPELGRTLAFDGKAIRSFSTGRTCAETGTTSDPDADWGVKSYRGVDSRGGTWSRVVRWFGYQLLLIVDADLELPVAYEVDRASTSEVRRLLPMVEELKARHPRIVEDARELVADRGADSGTVNRALWEDHGIKPVIETRRLWRAERKERGRDPEREITRPVNPDRVDTVVDTETGSVRCVCPVTRRERRMVYWGFEAERGTLKYRCPAAAGGYQCRGAALCHAMAGVAPGRFGRVVRIPLEADRRAFTPIPRESLTWRRSCAKRMAVERVNARLDVSFGFEQHTIRGLRKMRARVGLALAVMLAMAVGHVGEGRSELMRSLVGSPRRRRRAA